MPYPRRFYKRMKTLNAVFDDDCTKCFMLLTIKDGAFLHLGTQLLNVYKFYISPNSKEMKLLMSDNARNVL